MAILYLVNKEADLTACMNASNGEDHLVLMGDGVYGAINNDVEVGSNNLSAITQDVEARGLLSTLAPEISQIGYDELVDLCCVYTTVVSWS